MRLLRPLAQEHRELLAAILEVLADGDAGHRARGLVHRVDAGDAGDDLPVPGERLDDEVARIVLAFAHERPKSVADFKRIRALLAGGAGRFALVVGDEEIAP